MYSEILLTLSTLVSLFVSTQAAISELNKYFRKGKALKSGIDLVITGNMTILGTVEIYSGYEPRS